MNSPQRKQSPEHKKDIPDSSEEPIMKIVDHIAKKPGPRGNRSGEHALKRIGHIAEKKMPEAIIRSETYLKGTIDFVKWTSTITIAAMLWIGNNITSIIGTSEKIATLALICLAGSLFFAILTARLVIVAWKRQWTRATTEIDLTMASILTQEPFFSQDLQEPERSWLEERRTEYLEFTSKMPPMTHEDPKRFDTWVTWHLLYLLIGLSLYIIAQITAS